MKPQKTHGGKRPGSGRKPTGSKTLTRSLSMPPETWEELDARRGSQPRGKFVASLMDASATAEHWRDIAAGPFAGNAKLPWEE